uniref:AIMP2 thioredoxin-like domain-containing protein n=1 Tax=Parascaris univalens TaxID=6257 RepID=A0A915B8E8_PARUN
MYSLKPYFNFECTAIRPASIIYSLPNYHNDQTVCPQINRTVVEEAHNSTIDAMLMQERQLLEEQQQNLIKQLNEFIQKLNITLISIGNRKRRSTGGKEPQIASQIAEPKEKLPKINSSTSRVAFSYKEDYSESVIIGQSLRPCLSPAIADFDMKKFPKLVSLEVSESDRDWLLHLSAIAVKRSIAFKGHLATACVDRPKCEIDVHISTDGLSKPTAVIGDVVIHGRIVIWKLLGCLVGIYPTDPCHVGLSTRIDRWLLMANGVMTNETTLESVCRLINPSLSRYDFLASANVVTVADVILKALIEKNGVCLANNVEMWLARVAEAIGNC